MGQSVNRQVSRLFLAFHPKLKSKKEGSCEKLESGGLTAVFRKSRVKRVTGAKSIGGKYTSTHRAEVREAMDEGGKWRQASLFCQRLPSPPLSPIFCRVMACDQML